MDDFIVYGCVALFSAHPQGVFFRDIGVGRHDLTPQNSTLLLRVKSVARIDLTKKPAFLDEK